MEHLFLSLAGEFETVSNRVFRSLGIDSPKFGESLNFGGVYAFVSVFGVLIQFESNFYDYEDRFDYMIAIKRDPLTDVQITDEEIRAVAGIVQAMLLRNFRITIGVERDDDLVVISP